MSYPAYTGDVPPHWNVGNIEDDDPQIIDDLLTDVGDAPEEVVEPSLPQPALVQPKPATRLLAATWNMPAGSSFQVLNEDTRRESLVVRVAGTGSDYVYLADENSKGNDMGAGRLYVSDLASFGDHNGPVFLTTPSTNAGVVTVSIWSVTL